MDIKQTRKKLGLTQADFGHLLGITGSTVSRMESGEIPVTEKTQLALEALVNRAKKKA